MQSLVAGAVLAATLMLTACSAPSNSDTGTGSAVITDPLSRPTEPWTLDRPTEDWFDAWCTALTAVDPGFDRPAGEVADQLTRTGDTLITTSSQLGAMPVPTFDGGPYFAADQVLSLAELGRSFHLAADQWAEGDTDDARTTVDQGLAASATDPGTLDPVIDAQLRNLPACQSVRPTF